MSVKQTVFVTGVFSALFCGCSFLRDLDDLEPSGAVGATDAGLDGSARACKPEMIEQRFADGTRFCIDRTEVTRRAYREFVTSRGGVGDEVCPGNTSFRPRDPPTAACALVESPADEDLPVVCVDACDAAAYCRARGARLCGAKGGANLPADQVNSTERDEWFVACSGGARTFASGFDAGGCLGGGGGPVRVETSSCATPDGLLHLSGNVDEWTAACGPSPSGDVRCLARGGSFEDVSADGLACAHSTGSIGVLARATRLPSLGFRCCADP